MRNFFNYTNNHDSFTQKHEHFKCPSASVCNSEIISTKNYMTITKCMGGSAKYNEILVIAIYVTTKLWDRREKERISVHRDDNHKLGYCIHLQSTTKIYIYIERKSIYI